MRGGHLYQPTDDVGLVVEGLTGSLPFGPFDASVQSGIDELTAYLGDRAVQCPSEVYVLGGYSEGADVVGRALGVLPAALRDRIAFVALFGDPILDTGNWRPAGSPPVGGFLPACFFGKKPWVRGSAPCWITGGIFGSHTPYVPSDMEGRVGSWCRDQDAACDGSIFDVPASFNPPTNAHYAYFQGQSPDAVEAALETAQHLQTFVPAHGASFDVTYDELVKGRSGADLAIIFDTTGSMTGAITDAASQAAALAGLWTSEFTNGRVALVDFKDQGDAYVARVDLGLTSDAAAFQAAVSQLTAYGGGDTPEAQLSGIMTGLDGLSWASGATKAVVVITDAPGKDPEPVTNFTRASVAEHALQIDPVAIYGVNVSGLASVADWIAPMADATAGEVVTPAAGQSLSDALSQLFRSVFANPVAILTGPYIAPTGQAIRFDASRSYDAAAAITSYRWDFNGDGTVDATTTVPAISYAYPGEFHGSARVEVVGGDGRSAIATTQVTVDGIGLANLQPLAPASATYVASGASQVTVSWTPAASDRAEGYKIYRADGAPARFTTAADPHTAVIDGVDLGQPVQLWVVAANGYGESAGTAVSGSGREAVNDDAGSADQTTPRATAGLDGNVYAVWADARNSSSIYDIYFAKRSANGSWGANQRADDSPASASAPALAVDAAGNAYALWVDSRRGDADIWFSKRSAATGTWSASVRVNDDAAGSAQSAPSIAVSPTGDAVALWVDGRSKKSNIYSARLAAGSSVWSPNYKASSDSTITKSWPDVAIGSDGKAYAVWTQTKNGTSAGQFTTLAAGSTTWATDVAISDPGFSQSASAVRVDTAGDVLVTGGHLGTMALWSRYRPAGGAWGSAAYVSTTSHAFGGSISMRANGIAYAAWTDLNDQIYGARWDAATRAWGPQQQITTAGSHSLTSIALNATAAVVVARDYATQYDIRAYPTTVP